MSSNPFSDLGLDARPDLTDADVREAWRTVAAATHPDRDDGGNPAAYTAASAAYSILRTPWARSEAYADLTARVIATGPPPATAAPAALARIRHATTLLAARIRHGRPLALAGRLAAAALLAVVALHSGTGPAHVAPALTGIATWLALTLPADLAPPPGR